MSACVVCVFGCGYGFVPCADAAIWWQVRRLFVIEPPVFTRDKTTINFQYIYNIAFWLL